jgi:hypothetical protein
VFDCLHTHWSRVGIATATVILLLTVTVLIPLHNCGTALAHAGETAVSSSLSPVCMTCIIGCSIAVLSLMLLFSGLTIAPEYPVTGERSPIHAPRRFGFYLRPPPALHSL